MCLPLVRGQGGGVMKDWLCEKSVTALEGVAQALDSANLLGDTVLGRQIRSDLHITLWASLKLVAYHYEASYPTIEDHTDIMRRGIVGLREWMDRRGIEGWMTANDADREARG